MEHQQRSIYDYYLEIESNGEMYYTFETVAAFYTVYFNPNEYENRIEANSLLVSNSYGFGFFRFEKIPCANPHNDLKIKYTIERIICDFFNGMPNALLLYHCYYGDGKQHQRSNTFERWYRRSSAKTTISKHEIELEILTNGVYVTHYIGYLCGKTNPIFLSIQQEFENFVLLLPESKASLE